MADVDPKAGAAARLSAEGEAHFRAGRFAEALPLIAQAAALIEATFGKDSREVALSCNQLATLHHLLGELAAAQPLYARALAILDALAGRAPAPPEPALGLQLAATAFNLGRLHQDLGAPAAALPLHQRALALREQLLGPSHPEVARSLSSLASACDELGDQAAAQPLYKQALCIWEHLDPADPACSGEPLALNCAACLNDLGTLHLATGRYDEALPLYEQALELRQQELSEDHPEVAQSLNNLACLCAELGWYAEALPLQLRELASSMARLGTDDLDVATSQNNVGRLYEDLGRPADALPRCKEALRIREKCLGPEDPLVAQSLCHVARLSAELGQPQEALALHQRALRIREVKLGPAHPATASSLRDLAVLLAAQGQTGQAVQLHERALAIREAALGPGHVETLRSQRELAELLMSEGRDRGRGLGLLRQALAGAELTLRQVRTIGHEPRLAAFLATLAPLCQLIYGCLLREGDAAQLRELALTAALLHKGRTLDELADLSQVVRESLTSAQQHEQLSQLRSVERQLASLGLRAALDPSGSSEPDARLEQLRREADQLAQALARACGRLNRRQALPHPDQILAQVAAAIPADAVLIEFLAVGSRYAAVTLFPDGSSGCVALGDGVDEAVAALLDSVGNQREAVAPGERLWQLVMRPLLPLLRGRRQLILSLDEALHLVPFAALHDGEEHLLGRYELTLLTSGRDLLRTAALRPPGPSVIVAAPDFGCAPDAVLSLPALPGAQAEGEAIAQALRAAGLGVELLTGAQATEDAFLKLVRPAILHVATHGLFLDGKPVPQAAPKGDAAAARNTYVRRRPRPLRTESRGDPLLRSALALAGAAGAGDAQGGDGLVAALEVAGMNLDGTQLVVLSACESGQGELRRGQGVYGLRRAVMAAGAATLVTSLWKVSDEATRMLMVSYYDLVLAGVGRGAAMRRAAAQVRQRFPHPYYWAPFLVLGQSGPLELPAPKNAGAGS